MAPGKIRSAAQTTAKVGKATESVFRLDSTALLWLLGASIGAFPLVMMAVVALIVVLVILALFGSTMSSQAYPSASGSASVRDRQIIEMYGGDGTGTFNRKVPDPALAEIIEDAAGECDLLTPVILAAQIDYASGFDATRDGGAGRRGLSQLTPEVFSRFGEDSDGNGTVSVLDVADDIHAHARYFCHLATEVEKLIDAGTVTGDRLTLTLMAWEIGLEAVKAYGGMPIPDPATYPFQVRLLFDKYTGTPAGTPVPAKPEKKPRKTPSGLSEERFEEIFPNRDPLYSYAGLTDAMSKFPAFAGTGDPATRNRELAAFLGNIDHESGGLVHTEELNRAAWGDYCDPGQSYGCPAGQDAYHGRGPIQLSWNYNYKAAGDALGIDLLNEPDLVRTDSSVAWQTALWFWMTQRSAGPVTAHEAITGGDGFGATIRVINGMECDGGNPGQVSSRISSYRRIAGILGTDPGEDRSLTC